MCLFETQLYQRFSDTFGDRKWSVAERINELVYEELISGEESDIDDDRFAEFDFVIQHDGRPYDIATRFDMADESLLIALVSEVESEEEKTDKQRVHDFFYE